MYHLITRRGFVNTGKQEEHPECEEYNIRRTETPAYLHIGWLLLCAYLNLHIKTEDCSYSPDDDTGNSNRITADIRPMYMETYEMSEHEITNISCERIEHVVRIPPYLPEYFKTIVVEKGECRTEYKENNHKKLLPT